MRKCLLVGLIVGLIISFIDSYTYAISGYTTAEISLIIIPFLIISTFKLLKTSYSNEDIVIATALAFGISITTTLTSGMYITFGFLNYLSDRLKAYGLSVTISSNLFSGVFLDYNALPTYISLTLISFSGALIAFVFRGHFIERERLRYPIGFVSAILTKVFDRIFIHSKHFILLLVLGFILQITTMRSELFLDLTPLLSSIIPGAVLALTFWPIVIGLLFILPLEPLKMITAGSISTYIIFIPLVISLFRVKVPPALNFEEALFSYSTVIVGLLIGVVIILLITYLIMYSKILATGIVMVFKLKMERTIFILAIVLLSMLTYMIVVIFGHYAIITYVIPIIFLHTLLTIVNLRAVGEAGIGSQALLPLVTLYLYFLGARDVSIYATLDPYTGIPMPQVVGGSTMNLLRFTRLLKCSSLKALVYLGIGMLVGSFITFTYGNILLHVYGFNSPKMPLARWIPTIIWMSTIYNGKLGIGSLASLLLGLFIGIALIIISLRKSLPMFSFVIGMTLPPDIGVISLIVYLVKRILVELGAEAHEKCIVYSMLFLIGCGLAIVLDTFLTMVGV
jgi:hypothetical protein